MTDTDSDSRKYQVWCEDCHEVLVTMTGKNAAWKASDFAKEHRNLTGHNTSFSKHTPWDEQEGVENRDEPL
jgi:siroheme synthase (precorrin-2 oxidase/ferrochelatase)